MNVNIKNELENVVSIINSTVNSKEIYLFGSFATGQNRDDSDFDIYVVLDAEEVRPIKAIQKINYALSSLDLRSIDILAGYQNAFVAAAKTPSIEREILKRGVKLYDRDSKALA